MTTKLVQWTGRNGKRRSAILHAETANDPDKWRQWCAWNGYIAPMTSKPTIWQALAAKLGREPTNAEAKAECLRILNEAHIERASAGKLAYQRKGAHR